MVLENTRLQAILPLASKASNLTMTLECHGGFTHRFASHRLAGPVGGSFFGWAKWIWEMDEAGIQSRVIGAATTIECDGGAICHIHPDDMKVLLLARKTRWPALMRAQTACEYCGVSLSTWKTYNAHSKIPAPYTLEGCVVWKKTELDLWIEWDFPGRTVFESRLKAQK